MCGDRRGDVAMQEAGDASMSRRGSIRNRLSAAAFARCEKGIAALELGLVAMPLTMLLVGILQLVVFQYTQSLLSNGLYDSAARPPASVLASDQSLFKGDLCDRIVIMARASCVAAVVVEMARLDSVATTATPITGTTFSSGTSQQAIVLRAALPVTQFVPFIPVMTAKSSVVFRKP